MVEGGDGVYYTAAHDFFHCLSFIFIAAGLGVDVDNLLVSQPDSGEMALDIVDKLVRSAAVDVIVVDSVAALVPRAELEGDMADFQIGLQARLMSKAMRKITGSLALSQCTVIFLNQLRSKVCVISVTCSVR
jgi:recombination protein RecA